MTAPLFLFFLGLFFGSFANVLILRLQKKQKGIINGHSECPNCKHRLGFWDLVPVFSWLFLRGKCRYCQKKISAQYPLVELSMGICWALVAFFHPALMSTSGELWGSFLLQIFLVSSLLILSVYDIKFLEIPDIISLPTIGVLLFTLPFSFTPSWSDALLGAAIPLVFFLLQILISQGKWVGGGDLRMGAIMGLTLGVQKTIVSLFLSYFLGAVICSLLLLRKRKKFTSQIAFGPFLAAGTVLGMLWGNTLLEIAKGGIGF